MQKELVQITQRKLQAVLDDHVSNEKHSLYYLCIKAISNKKRRTQEKQSLPEAISLLLLHFMRD